ncbi:DUF308 domain-containing protein [Facklamia miroungae]|uniref:DUF308 domain-containing protein n=1 Tax=Facklamia miroungae TaxID=120956 RepID=A0A1G7T641_9LACT|nr:DUF308 domain-containing protein [Facklamia miroungae]NKZ29682.1 hypothetical protein [Facklamia miroungae]SDG30837.1 Short repeat of unknown function [Facklamia miroungae]
MKKIQRRNHSYLIFGLSLLVIGMGLVLFKVGTANLIMQFIALSILIMGSMRLWDLKFGQKFNGSPKDKRLQIFIVLAQVFFAIGLLIYHENSYLWMIRAIGIYQLIMSILNFFSYYLMRQDGAHERHQRLAFALVHLFFALDSIIATSQGHPALIRLGIYLIFLGITYIHDGRFALIDPRKEQAWRRTLRIPLPVIFSALLPQKLIHNINEIITGRVNDLYPDLTSSLQTFDKGIAKDQDHRITIQIHVGTATFDMVGHMNIIYKGVVYFYGNHDVDSRNLFDTAGDGVLALIDQEEYLAFALRNRLTIVEYDIAITPEQAQLIEEKMSEMKEEMVVWHPQSKAVLKSFVGKLKRETNHTVFYKFKAGQFQTYFVFWTNCVLFSDNILEAMGLDLFPLIGIQTPGTYYDFLEREYQKEESIIIERRVYSQVLRNYLSKLSFAEPKEYHQNV